MGSRIEHSGELYEWVEDITYDISRLDLRGGRVLHSFLVEERAFWVDVLGPNEEIKSKFPFSVSRISALANYRTAVKPFLQFDSRENENLHSLFREVIAFYSNTALPLHGSRFGKFLLKVSKEDHVLATSCLETWLTSSTERTLVADKEMEQTIKALKEGGFIEVPVEKRPKQEDVELIEKLHALVENLAHQQKLLQVDIVELKDEWGGYKLDETDSLSKACEKLETQGNDLVIEFTNKLGALESAWKTNAEIDDSVNYWKDKAGEHQKKSARFGRIAAGYFAFMSIVIVVLFWCLPEMLKNISSDEFKFHAYVVQVALGFAASTLFIWVGRILTRLFLSEHHLRIDADERLVMTKTFLAFTAEGKIDKALLPILLAPLFRPTADGIVKDDAAPEFSLAAFLTKTGPSN